MTGSVPNLKFNFKLRVMHLNNNYLTGTIPRSIQFLKRLVSLRLDKNSFTSTIPSTIVKLRNITELDLSSNLFRGAIKSLFQLNTLQKLYLNDNSFTGTIS